jgi:DNA-directed RNA polymerase specialized sigma24 family protein
LWSRRPRVRVPSLTPQEEAGNEPPLRLRGDELDLYAEYHFELIRKISRDVRPASRENVEDACAFAWVEFFKKQPDREGDRWKGWLYVAAKRETWRLNAQEWKEREHVTSDDVAPLEFADPRDHLAERLEFQAALQELRKLPPLLQEVVMVRSQVWKQGDVAEIMGLSRQRVATLLVAAACRWRSSMRSDMKTRDRSRRRGPRCCVSSRTIRRSG